MTIDIKNKLFYGDNLTVMKEQIPDNSIDLIYLDPPFNSNRNYNKIYRDLTGRDVPEQVEAFCDTWEMDAEKVELMKEITNIMRFYKIDEYFITFFDTWIQGLQKSNSKLLAYLLYMTVRLLEMRKKLKDTGSIYLHCDPTASHYIKVMMDGIFGHDNFRNEIIWGYRTGGVSKKHFARKHDVIFSYSKNHKKTFFEPLKYKSYQNKKYNYNLDYPEYFDEEKQQYYHLSFMRDVWDDVNPLGTGGNERLGYPTQKPIALLDRIIESSCPPDGVVLDPFCGCGTSLYSAHKNKRNWIGIDIATLSVNLVKQTLENRYNIIEKKDYEMSGYPLTVEQAEMLFKKDPFQFQNWAIEEVYGFCSSKKTRDGGIDGAIYFRVTGERLEQKMTLSVKGGKLKATDIRDIMRVVERENWMMGGIICFDEPTKDMKHEMAMMGMVTIDGISYEKMQYLTVSNILEGKKLFHVPTILKHKDEVKTHQTKLPM